MSARLPLRSSAPDSAGLPACGLPAIDGWVIYDYAEGKPRWVEAFPYCRFHEQTQHVVAREAAAKTGPKASIYPANYQAGQSRVACTGDRNPVQLGAVLDAERIIRAADTARAALRQLTHLTTAAVTYTHEIGNEGAVLEALLELVDDVEEEAGVVARRLAGRAGPTGWFRVAEVTGNVRPEDLGATKLSVATKLWRRWGGGLDDDAAPALPSGPAVTL